MDSELSSLILGKNTKIIPTKKKNKKNTKKNTKTQK